MPRIVNVRNRSAAAVWLVPVEGRLFACVFGYGWTLLNPGSFEEDFGLKVTLNCVDPNRLHSIDRTTLDTISRHSQIQASHLAPIGEFGLDVEQDILQAVAGEPTSISLGKKLAGKDSLHASVHLSFTDIPSLLGRYLGLYRSTQYKEFFSFVDHIRLIRDPVKLDQLNRWLVEKIRTERPDRLWLSIPEPIRWERIDHFSYKPSRVKGQYSDLHFDQLGVEIRELPNVDLDRLKSIRVLGISSESELPAYDWQLFKCINYEVSEGNRSHVLNNGKWYEVASDFVSAVAETCRGVASSDARLPRYEDKNEETYNRRVASSDPLRLVCLDRGSVVYPMSPSRIEFCDIYTDEREMIFVKRYGDSSVLSHLFAQGVVSAETFRREKGFRELVNRSLPATHALGEALANMRPHEFTVTFAVVSDSMRPLHESLPFFSKVNLRNAVKLLESNGYNVRLAKIEQSRSALPQTRIGKAASS